MPGPADAKNTMKGETLNGEKTTRHPEQNVSCREDKKTRKWERREGQKNNQSLSLFFWLTEEEAGADRGIAPQY